ALLLDLSSNKIVIKLGSAIAIASLEYDIQIEILKNERANELAKKGSILEKLRAILEGNTNRRNYENLVKLVLNMNLEAE
ncbi:36561_t:CDS:2, partial [Gigaspora margarita]